MLPKTRPLERVGHVLGKFYSPGFGILLLVVTYVPMILVIIFSFNQSIIAAFPLEKFSLIWYRELLADESILVAFRNTILIALGAVAGSLLIGVTAAFVLHRFNFRGAKLYQVIVLLPFLLPGIFTGLALLLFFATAGIPKSLFTVFIGHVVFCEAFFSRLPSGLPAAWGPRCTVDMIPNKTRTINLIFVGFAHGASGCR